MTRTLDAFFKRSPEAGRVAVGCMTGSSVDALDVAWVRAEGIGLAMRAEVLEEGQVELGALRDPLRRLARQEPFSAREIAVLAHDLGELHARALSPGGAVEAPPIAELVAIHGQTVAHDGLASWALFDPAPVAARLQVPIVTDLRLVDRAADGEGAPITPLADWVLLRGPAPRAAVNLGGFCNFTSLPPETGSPDAVTGRDVCPCNQLLDAAARRWFDVDFDADGARAIEGAVDSGARERVLAGLVGIGGRGRSLGTGDEGFGLLDELD
ncbi:MAG: anhydro-N-acetylmuramic acid kinase, partial [Planctomycetota bacterium]